MIIQKSVGEGEGGMGVNPDVMSYEVRWGGNVGVVGFRGEDREGVEGIE